MSRKFLDLYCEALSCSADEFERRILAKCLYPQARLLAPILRVIARDHFALDVRLVSTIGLMSTRSRIDDEIRVFQDELGNRGMLRKSLRLRLSTRRLHRVINQHIKPDPSSRRGLSSASTPSFSAL